MEDASAAPVASDASAAPGSAAGAAAAGAGAAGAGASGAASGAAGGATSASAGATDADAVVAAVAGASAAHVTRVATTQLRIDSFMPVITTAAGSGADSGAGTAVGATPVTPVDPGGDSPGGGPGGGGKGSGGPGGGGGEGAGGPDQDPGWDADAATGAGRGRGGASGSASGAATTPTPEIAVASAAQAAATSAEASRGSGVAAGRAEARGLGGASGSGAATTTTPEIVVVPAAQAAVTARVDAAVADPNPDPGWDSDPEAGSDIESDEEDVDDLPYATDQSWRTLVNPNPDAKRVEQRDVQMIIAEKVDDLLFRRGDDYDARPVDANDLRKLMEDTDKDETAALRAARQDVLVGLVDEVICDGVGVKDRWSTFFGESSGEAVLRKIPMLLSMVFSRVLLRSKRDCDVRYWEETKKKKGEKKKEGKRETVIMGTTPFEKVVLKRVIEVVVDEHVAMADPRTGLSQIPAFFVLKATPRDGVRVAKVFPDSGARGRWNPQESRGTFVDDTTQCVASLGTTAYRALRYEESTGGGRGASPYARAFKHEGPERSALVFQKMGKENAIHESMASPFPAIVARIILGSSAERVALPQLRDPSISGGIRGKNTTDMYNAFCEFLRDEPSIPPLGAGLCVLRLLPSWNSGAVCVSPTLPESMFVGSSSWSGDHGSVQIATPLEGTRSTLRDRSLVALLMHLLAKTDAAVVVELERKNLERKNLERKNLAADADDDAKRAANDYIFPAFDNLGLLQQAVLIFIVTVVVEEMCEAMLEREPELAVKARALELMMYAKMVRGWARGILECRGGYSKAEAPLRRTPTRRRRYLLTLLFVLRVKHVKLMGWNKVHGSVPRALRFAHGLSVSFTGVDGTISPSGYDRMRECVASLRREVTLDLLSSVAAVAQSRAFDSKTTVWFLNVRASVADQLHKTHSLRGQVATCLWLLRDHAVRLRKKGEQLGAPAEIILGVATGSKMFPRRINTFVVRLVPGGPAFRFFCDFVLAWEANADRGSAFPLPHALLGFEVTRRAVVRDIVDAILLVTGLEGIPRPNDEGVVAVAFGDRCAYVPGGGNKEDDNLEHRRGFGNDVLLGTCASLIAKGRKSEGLDVLGEANVVAATSYHDRRGPGYVAAMTDGDHYVDGKPVAHLRLTAVHCLASSAILDARPELACPKTCGFLSSRAAYFLIETNARLSAVCTAELSVTMSAGDATAPEKDRRARSYAERLKKIPGWKNTEKGRARGAKLGERPRPAVLFHRRSNPAVGNFVSQARRNRELFEKVDREDDSIKHDRVFRLFLDGFKGTDRVPVGSDPGAERRVYVQEPKLEDQWPSVANFPDGFSERGDLGAFVVPMLKKLIREEKRQDGAADLFFTCVSRVCLANVDGSHDAVDALHYLHEQRGWRIFSWDITEAARIDTGIQDRMLRADNSLNLDDELVRRVLKSVALGDRLWRIANGFYQTIHD